MTMEKLRGIVNHPLSKAVALGFIGLFDPATKRWTLS